jgi:hypothetical protein
LNKKPEALALDEVLAMQTDLYVSMTLNENIQRQRIKRKRDRMIEEMTSKLSKVNGFVEEALKANDVKDKVKIENELL